MTRMPPEPQLVERVDAAVKRRNARLLSNGEIAFTCPSPELHANGDAHSSARWNRAKAVWWCDVCEAGDGMIDLARRLGVVLPPDGRPRRDASRRETGRWTIATPPGTRSPFTCASSPARGGRRRR
jgi:hypothetical protein